jgi:hypothetical protein
MDEELIEDEQDEEDEMGIAYCYYGNDFRERFLFVVRMYLFSWIEPF